MGKVKIGCTLDLNSVTSPHDSFIPKQAPAQSL